MALNDKQHRYTTWTDYYKKILVESASAGVELLNNVCDDLAIDYLNNAERYLNCILENPKLNFILVPSTSGKGRIDCHQWSGLSLQHPTVLLEALRVYYGRDH